MPNRTAAAPNRAQALRCTLGRYAPDFQAPRAYEIFSGVKFRSPQKPRVISIRHGGTCGSKNFGQKSSFAISTANVRFGRLRTGTCRTSRRIAPTGRGLGAEDPLEGLFLGQNCRAVRMGALLRRSKHCVMARFRSKVYMGRLKWGRTVLWT